MTAADSLTFFLLSFLSRGQTNDTPPSPPSAPFKHPLSCCMGVLELGCWWGGQGGEALRTHCRRPRQLQRMAADVSCATEGTPAVHLEAGAPTPPRPARDGHCSQSRPGAQVPAPRLGSSRGGGGRGMPQVVLQGTFHTGQTGGGPGSDPGRHLERGWRMDLPSRKGLNCKPLAVLSLSSVGFINVQHFPEGQAVRATAGLDPLRE